MKRLISMLLLLAMLLSCLPVSVLADDTAIIEAEEIVDAAPTEDADAEELPEEEPLEEEVPAEETPEEQSSDEEMAVTLSADGERFFYFSAETKKELLIAPRKISFTAGSAHLRRAESGGHYAQAHKRRLPVRHQRRGEGLYHFVRALRAWTS